MVVEPVRYRFSVDEYHRMGEAGVFEPDARVELIDGEVIEMSPIGSRHAGCVNRVTRLFVRAVGDDAVVVIQNPVILSELSEPQPDLVLARPRDDFYASGHPTPADILLAMEVSDTSLAFDTRVKVPLYAAAGVPEVWIVDLPAAALRVYRELGPGGYSESLTLRSGDSVTLSGLPSVTVAVADILG
ncbi:MAG: Uma2 family endonuclease [Acidimicrobiales bacterium]